MKRLFALLILPVFFAGCTSPDKIMAYLDDDSPAAISSGIKELTVVADKSSESSTVRCAAIKVLGIWARPEPDTLSVLNRLVVNERGCIGSWAAWALGKMARPEAIQYLNRALSKNPSHSKAALILEALANLYPFIIQDSRIKQETLEALTAYSSRLKTPPPEIYRLLDNAVTDLDMLDKTLKKNLVKNSVRQGNPDDVRKLYRILIKTSRYLADNRETIATRAVKDRQLLLNLNMRFSSRVLLGRSFLVLPLLANLGRCVGLDALAPLFEGSLIVHFSRGGRSIKLVSLWGMARMLLFAGDARRLLRNDFLLHNVDGVLFRLIADIFSGKDEADFIQRLFNIPNE